MSIYLLARAKAPQKLENTKQTSRSLVNFSSHYLAGDQLLIGRNFLG